LKNLKPLKFMKIFSERNKRNRRLYYAVISSVALSSGNAALAQTNVVSSDTSTNIANLGNVTVIGQLDQARSQIVPNLGATAYTHTAAQIESQSQGGNAPMNQVILRSPGVAQDSFGGERRPARSRRTREFAVSHQRRAAARRHHGFWLGTRPALH
jgi:hypothetical protein